MRMRMIAGYMVPLFYLLSGIAIIYLFHNRRKGVARIRHSQLPELPGEDYSALIILLKTAYERMLYLGVLFLPLSFSSFQASDKINTVFFLLLIGLLFISNILPRHNIMKLLKKYNLSADDLRQRGINL